MARRVFTAVVIKAIRDWASQGKSASEIAAAIGSTAASVRVKCCQLKIQLSRRGRPSLVPSWPQHPGEHKLVIYMRPEDYAALERKAAHMHKSPAELAGMLLEEIVSADIFQAVLGDGK
ncbi:MAG: hypothetical protein WB760_33835 [Xanthobacteraceae bacterium]